MLFLDEIGELGLDEQAMLLRALEEKRFLPLGGDEEVSSDFQLIAGTNRDLARRRGARAAFARTCSRASTCGRSACPASPIGARTSSPNLDYELEQFRRRTGTAVTFSQEAREQFLAFATSRTRTLAGQLPRPQRGDHAAGDAGAGRAHHRRSGRRRRSRTSRRRGGSPAADREPALVDRVGRRPSAAATLDRFDRVQLEDVLRCAAQRRACRPPGACSSTARAQRKQSVNDADRLRKYLARFELEWAEVKRRLPPAGSRPDRAQG